MSQSDKWRWFYKVMRSVIFIAVGIVVMTYLGLYITLSIPAVQRRVCSIAENEVSTLVGSRVTIGDIEINPFNEVTIKDLILFEPVGNDKRCLTVQRLGAGISLWNLVRYGKIVITYVELINFDARVRQEVKDGPLNIQFLIDAFAPKDKNKPPAKFDLKILNIVIRRGSASFDREWQPREGDKKFDINHLSLHDLRGDVMLPRLSNDNIEIDLRRLAFRSSFGIDVESLSMLAKFIQGDLNISDFRLRFASGEITINDIFLPLSRYSDINRLVKDEIFDIDLKIRRFSPAQLATFYPAFSNLNSRIDLDVVAAGNFNDISLRSFNLTDDVDNINLAVNDLSLHCDSTGFSHADLGKLNLKISEEYNNLISESFLGDVSPEIKRIINGAGEIRLNAEGNFNSQSDGEIDVNISSDYGDISLEGSIASHIGGESVKLHLNSDSFAVGNLVDSSEIGLLALELDAEINSLLPFNRLGILEGRDPEVIINNFNQAEIRLKIPEVELKTYSVKDFDMSLYKRGDRFSVLIDCPDDNCDLSLSVDGVLAGSDSQITLDGDIMNFRPARMMLLGDEIDYSLSGSFEMNIHGDNPDNLSGLIELNSFKLKDYNSDRELNLGQMRFIASLPGGVSSDLRHYLLTSDWVDGSISGYFRPTRLPEVIHDMLANAFPTLIPHSGSSIIEKDNMTEVDFNFTVKRDGEWIKFLNLPFNLLYEAEVKGSVRSADDEMQISMDAPYIQQGKDKLIRHTRLSASMTDNHILTSAYSSIPTKKGILDLQLDLDGYKNFLDIAVGLNPGSKGAFYGDFIMQAAVVQNLKPGGIDISLKFLPSQIHLNDAVWDIGKADIIYADGRIVVNNLSISHDRQYISIAGVASPLMSDEVIVKLQDIDLSYIFDTLNIEVAMFGGTATGEAVGRGLLSNNMEAFTRHLHVDSLSYNNAIVGTGELRGDFDMLRKRVGICADIAENGRYVANVDGGIWIGKDSLAFDFDADKVRVGFLQPFMKAFSSKVEGRASGKCHLYGTFKDVNMTGRMFADTIAIKVDYTNTLYCGSDSVIMSPGRIDIPRFKLYDEYGNSAILTGTLEHDYFHNPEFDFRVIEARSLMLYDTNPLINPIWYGRIFGSGSGRIVGNDEYVRVIADMTTEAGTDFTFVLDDSKEASDYGFLTFTDKRKVSDESKSEAILSESDEIENTFRNKMREEQTSSSVFAMDIRASLTEAAKMNLVMDHVAGDKIVARGEGSINMEYNTMIDLLKMYGKYTLSEGVYNFSLQDLILKDFIIKEGSSISFNGDPLQALLNIRAAYRVNTNLTDLDASFATDKDLNRVNVPVDAMLLVNGELEHPDIKFDIELPTLNDEVEQKVRSIISSEDLMNTQMIYLLALNRFYTPDYGKSGNSGGEWASVASSTLSSQLQNILGQLTDKVSFSPSLRSDKGDFSDLQVDLALSSSLFNNRLLINGNFGYRDRSTSSTTFIGDFDLEYLLNRRGNLRLKAYNHFNDQNYYLKSALTTQGIGVVWRKDFNRLFPLRRKKGDLYPEIPIEPRDSVGVNNR